jgi:hypothetical protein
MDPGQTVQRRPSSVLTIRVLAMLATLSVALSVMRVERLVRWLTPASLPSRCDLDQVERVVRHVDGVLRRVAVLPYGHCLVRSLILYYFCTRLGYPVQIAFGMRRGRDGLPIGHGWLVLDGNPFMERGAPDREFLQLWSLPPTDPGLSGDPDESPVASHGGRGQS